MRTRVRWLPLMDEYLLTKRMKGETFKLIGSALGVSERAAHNRWFRRFPHVVVPQYIRRHRVHSLELRDSIVAMKKCGLSHKQIAEKTGLRLWQVAGIWNHWRDYASLRAAA